MNDYSFYITKLEKRRARVKQEKENDKNINKRKTKK